MTAARAPGGSQGTPSGAGAVSPAPGEAGGGRQVKPDEMTAGRYARGHRCARRRRPSRKGGGDPVMSEGRDPVTPSARPAKGTRRPPWPWMLIPAVAVAVAGAGCTSTTTTASSAGNVTAAGSATACNVTGVADGVLPVRGDDLRQRGRGRGYRIRRGHPERRLHPDQQPRHLPPPTAARWRCAFSDGHHRPRHDRRPRHPQTDLAVLKVDAAGRPQGHRDGLVGLRRWSASRSSPSARRSACPAP